MHLGQCCTDIGFINIVKLQVIDYLSWRLISRSVRHWCIYLCEYKQQLIHVNHTKKAAEVMLLPLNLNRTTNGGPSAKIPIILKDLHPHPSWATRGRVQTPFSWWWKTLQGGVHCKFISFASFLKFDINLYKVLKVVLEVGVWEIFTLWVEVCVTLVSILLVLKHWFIVTFITK